MRSIRARKKVREKKLRDTSERIRVENIGYIIKELLNTRTKLDWLLKY